MNKPTVNKPAITMVFVLILSFFLTNASFALWKHDSEVRFTLTISQPQDEFDCENYDTIQEGIDIHRDIRYPYIYDRMDQFEAQLEARVIELNNLPFGGITLPELQAECNNYRTIVNSDFAALINGYGQCINKLANFYNNSSQEEKEQVPDFWSQHTMLWELHTQLWNRRQALYTAIDAVWRAGEAKIDY
jgi:hypothetical protein